MDAHFNEYLAAVAGMAEAYGVADDAGPAFGSATDLSLGEAADGSFDDPLRVDRALAS